MYRNPHARDRHFRTMRDETTKRQPRPTPRRTTTRRDAVAAHLREW